MEIEVPYEGGIFSKSFIWDVPYQAFLGFPYGVPYGASPYAYGIHTLTQMQIQTEIQIQKETLIQT